MLLFQDGIEKARVDIPDAASLLAVSAAPHFGAMGKAAIGAYHSPGEEPDLKLVLRGRGQPVEAYSPADRFDLHAEELGILGDAARETLEATSAYITQVYEQLDKDIPVDVADIERELVRLGRAVRNTLPEKLLRLLQDPKLRSVFLDVHPNCDLPLELARLPNEEGFVQDRVVVSRYFAGTSAPLTRGRRQVDRLALLAGRDDLLKAEKSAIEARIAAEIEDFVELPKVEAEVFRSERFQAIHYIGHHERSALRGTPNAGLALAGGGVLQLVDLDDDRITEFFTKTRPIVMLNGCESVLPGAVLTLRDTFPHRFMRLEAAAFIGTLWPVERRGCPVRRRLLCRARPGKGGAARRLRCPQPHPCRDRRGEREIQGDPDPRSARLCLLRPT